MGAKKWFIKFTILELDGEDAIGTGREIDRIVVECGTSGEAEKIGYNPKVLAAVAARHNETDTDGPGIGPDDVDASVESVEEYMDELERLGREFRC